ncbi:MAG: hypothetical protein WBN56_11135 [Robiginitalea sp.]|uniref:hypothetical protein n=3 Tax=Robiginitalea sp. TaxID=1902411 RepID=UPI003C7113B9
MNNRIMYWLRRGLPILLLLIGPKLQADIVYPARLQLTETAPGVYEVFFVLPVIQGKILRAQAVFPEFCSSYSEPVTEVDSYQKKMRWQISCGENTLAGQQIGIDGLLGSQVDIILEINTLDGRIYGSTLSPARAYYTIPEPPAFKDYVQIGTFPAGRFVLLQWGLAVLVLLYFLIFRNPDFRLLLITLSGGLALGFFLDHNEWLLVPSWAATLLPLGAAAVISLGAFVKKHTQNQAIGKTLIGICGVLAGAGFMEEGTPGGYTSAESGILLGFACLGFLLGTWILISIGRQTSRVLDLCPDSFRRTFILLFSGLALGAFLWQMSLFWVVPSMLPAIPLLLHSYILILVFWTFYSKVKMPDWVVWAGLIPGFVLGFSGLDIPYSPAIILSLQGALLLFIFFGKNPSKFWVYGILLLSSLAVGNYLQSATADRLSYPLARSVFFVLLLTILALLFSLVLRHPWMAAVKGKILRWGSVFFLVVSLTLGGVIVASLYTTAMRPALLSGLLPIPVLSFVLLISAWLWWPRKKKIHTEIEVKQKAPVVSLVLLILALLWLPIHLNIRNPWYSADKMDSGVVHDLMESKLLNTYTAFNLSEEEELFERLSQNLDEDLLDHVYLDSRRRLTMGLRDGSTVTVKEVLLGELGDVIDSDYATEELRYPATWTVTAQVKHLKHIHYRKNKYTGTVGLKSVDNTWKISEITLISEDREVIASSAL